MPPAYQSETAKHRELAAPYCIGYGLDVGFGGDAVSGSAIRMDLPEPYANTGEASVQLGGDCRDLYWFRDETLDYVYSSHVLEDFPREETSRVLGEWARVLRGGGRLILLLPDQQRYLRFCEQTGSGPNLHHSIADFSLDYVRRVATAVGGLEVEAEHPAVGEYSFIVVFRKVGSGRQPADDLRVRLQAAWRERDETLLQLHELERSRLLRTGRAVKRILARRCLVRP